MNDIKDAESMHKCAHVPCQCLVPPAQEYCSAYCSEADDVEYTEHHCDCYHGKCASQCAPKREHRLFAACIEGQGSAVSSMATGHAMVVPHDSSRSFAN